MNGIDLIKEWLFEKGYVSRSCEKRDFHSCSLDTNKPFPASLCKHGAILRIQELPDLKLYIMNRDGKAYVAVRGKGNLLRRAKYGTDVVCFSDPDFFTKLGWMIFLDTNASFSDAGLARWRALLPNKDQ